MKRLLRVLLFSLLLLMGCASKEDAPAARTYYESLALDTPETAVNTFVNVFQRDDFEAVYLIFSPPTQSTVANKINTLNYQELIKVEDGEDVSELLSDSVLFRTVDEWEHNTGSYLFDSIMIVVKQHSAFLIDLSGDVSILRTEEIVDGERSFSDVMTTVEGIDGEVIFRMEQAPSGRWRVRQVIVPDGDEEQIPWSVPTEEE